VSNNSSVVVCIRYPRNVFNKLLPSTEGGIHLTRPLPYNNRTDTHTEGWEGFMKYTVKMGSVAMICIPGFIKISPCIKKLMGDTHSARRFQKHTLGK
jgi:hypothetical protein